MNKLKKYMGLYLIIVLFFCAYLLILEQRYNTALKDIESEYLVKVISQKQENKYTDRYIAKILKGKDKGFKIYMYANGKSTYKYGDILKVEGDIEFPSKARNDKGFDYSKYLKTQGIVASIFVEKISYIKREEGILSKVYDLKSRCNDILEENFDEDKSQILKALLLGNKSDITQGTKEVFSKSNLSHILAISGLHVTYIAFYIELILRKFINNIKIKNCCLILFLIIFMIFVGASPSAMRACITMIIYYIAQTLLKQKDFYTSFIISFLVILLINPYNIYSISMWLSFLGTLGIVLFSGILSKIILKKFNIKLDIIIISFSAQILISPIMWKTFGSISLNFWISNLFVSELIAPILILGYCSIIIFPLRNIIVLIESILLKLFSKIALISSQIPFNRIFLPKPSNYTIFAYYAFIFVLVCYYKKHKFTVLKHILNFNYLKNILKQISIFILIIIVITYFVNIIPKSLRINFLDVGQGDCTFIRTKYNKAVLIDSGEGNSDKYDYGQNVVLPYLLSHKTAKIDFLVLTHFDLDHSGGAFYLLENINVENIVIGVQAEKYENCIDFMKIAKKKNVNVIVLKSGDILKIDKETYLETIFPDLTHTILENSINNNSLVVKLVYKNFKMLFTGDIEEASESYIAEKYKDKLKADILKVAHHGSKTSSTDKFINYVRPKIALIGVGKNNNFGHPNEEVLKRFQNLRN